MMEWSRDRPADPQPARALPARRADRVRPRSPAASRGGPRARPTGDARRKADRSLRRKGLRRSPRIRARGRAKVGDDGLRWCAAPAVPTTTDVDELEAALRLREMRPAQLGLHRRHGRTWRTRVYGRAPWSSRGQPSGAREETVMAQTATDRRRRRRRRDPAGRPDVAAFWENVSGGRYSISDVTADRWDPALYYDPDPAAPEKTYSKIGGWVRSFEWDPLRVEAPDPAARRRRDGRRAEVGGQRRTRQVLLDYGSPERPLDRERTAVILGNAMAGEKHYRTALRDQLPRAGARARASADASRALPPEVRERSSRRRTSAERRDSRRSPRTRCPASSRTSSPVGWRTCSTSAARTTSSTRPARRPWRRWRPPIEGLVSGEYDAAITGGIDRNMGPRRT